MSSCNWTITALCLTLAAGVAFAADKKANGEKKAPAAAAPKAKKEAAAAEPRPSDWEMMIKELNLQGDQLAKFNQKVEARNAAEKAIVEKTKIEQLKTDLDAAKASKDEAKIKAAQEKYNAANKEVSAVRQQWRAEVMAVLTPEQQKKWAGWWLANRTLDKPLYRLNLTDEQKKQVRAITDKAAADLVKPDTCKTDPYFLFTPEVKQQLLDQVSAKVLTEDQRKIIAPRPAAAKKDAK